MPGYVHRDSDLLMSTFATILSDARRFVYFASFAVRDKSAAGRLLCVSLSRPHGFRSPWHVVKKNTLSKLLSPNGILAYMRGYSPDNVPAFSRSAQ